MVEPRPLPQPQPLELRVEDLRRLTPSLLEVSLGGEQLRALEWLPGQDVQFRFQAADRAVMRRYSIRRVDPRAGTLDLDVVLHGDGPAARRFRNISVGEALDGAFGPRGKITLDPEADWHLFLGDETYIPAVMAMLEALPSGRVATAVLEVPGPAEEQPLVAPGASLSWLHRGGNPPGDPALLSSALGRLPLPEGLGHAYIAGESRVAIALRERLAERGFPRERISAKGYWSRTRANHDRGEPDPE